MILGNDADKKIEHATDADVFVVIDKIVYQQRVSEKQLRLINNVKKRILF